jgi:hypothetical protein
VIKSINYDISAGESLSSFLINCITYKFISDSNIITLLNSIVLLGEIPKISANKIAKYIISDTKISPVPKSNVILYNLYIFILNKIKDFNELKEFYVKEIENSPDNKLYYENWLFEYFGHRNDFVFNSVIYNSIFN